MNGFQEKCKKTPFWTFWAKMANFGQFLAKMGKTGILFKKALGTFFSHLQALTNGKVSEKSNERFSRICVTNGRTNVIPLASNDFDERPKTTHFCEVRFFLWKEGLKGIQFH